MQVNLACKQEKGVGVLLLIPASPLLPILPRTLLWLFGMDHHAFLNTKFEMFPLIIHSHIPHARTVVYTLTVPLRGQGPSSHTHLFAALNPAQSWDLAHL